SIANRCLAFGYNAVIPTAACGQRHERRNILATRVQRELEARRTRLAHLEHGITPAEAIADEHLVFAGTIECQVLAHRSRPAGKRVLALPPWPVLRRIGIDRLVDAAMHRE